MAKAVSPKLKKNDIISLEIISVANDGSGVGRAQNGMTVFVPFTAVGDRIECRIVKCSRNYCYGIIETVTEASAHRCEIDCKLFGRCGGCAFRHIAYEEELRIKQGFVRDSFERIGRLDISYEPILGCKDICGYRNKVQLPVCSIGGTASAGFYAKRSHRVIPVDSCKLQPDVFSDIVRFVLEYHNSRGLDCYSEESGKGLLRHIYLRRGYHSGEIMLCLVVSRLTDKYDELAAAVMKEFGAIRSVVLNVNPKRSNVILGAKCVTLAGSDCIKDVMCKNEISISPLSFYQVNTAQAERLYGTVAEYAGLTGGETLLDMYCGAGTIGLSMAERAGRLIGVEEVESAVVNARENARRCGALNAEYICADAGMAAERLLERKEKVDVIVADPARKGCDKRALDAMVMLSPERIVMVSCNHATAARDCAYLAANGYEPIKCRAVDLFPRTEHVEAVVLMSRVKP